MTLQDRVHRVTDALRWGRSFLRAAPFEYDAFSPGWFIGVGLLTSPWSEQGTDVPTDPHQAIYDIEVWLNDYARRLGRPLPIPELELLARAGEML